MAELTYEDIQAVREEVCEGCKGDWLADGDCREWCDVWKEAVDAARQEKTP